MNSPLFFNTVNSILVCFGLVGMFHTWFVWFFDLIWHLYVSQTPCLTATTCTRSWSWVRRRRSHWWYQRQREGELSRLTGQFGTSSTATTAPRRASTTPVRLSDLILVVDTVLQLYSSFILLQACRTGYSVPSAPEWSETGRRGIYQNSHTRTFSATARWFLVSMMAGLCVSVRV